MTEGEWLTGNDLAAMMGLIAGRTGERKRRLFACACCRRSWDSWDGQSRQVFQRFEEGADRKGGEEALASPSPQPGPNLVPLTSATLVEVNLQLLSQFVLLGRALDGGASPPFRSHVPLYPGDVFACSVLREVFGNPFRDAVADPAWLVWNEATVEKVAKGAYEERAFDRLPILADGLEEAGCADEAILAHCRGPGPHVRGCWAVDLLLGRAAT